MRAVQRGAVGAGRHSAVRHGGVVWCGVVLSGVVWCGVVWCGVVWCGVGRRVVIADWPTRHDMQAGEPRTGRHPGGTHCSADTKNV